MTFTTVEQHRQIGINDGKEMGSTLEVITTMFEPQGGPAHVAYLEGVIQGLRSAIMLQQDDSDVLTLNIQREVEAKEVAWMVFGAGALGHSWWGRVTWQAQVDDESWGDVPLTEDFDIAEPTDQITIVSWDGEEEGGRKVSTITFAQIVAAVSDGIARNLIDPRDVGVTEDLALFDASMADLILQLAVFGEPVYG